MQNFMYYMKKGIYKIQKLDDCMNLKSGDLANDDFLFCFNLPKNKSREERRSHAYF